jgi:hypothetical protein
MMPYRPNVFFLNVLIPVNEGSRLITPVPSIVGLKAVDGIDGDSSLNRSGRFWRMISTMRG